MQRLTSVRLVRGLSCSIPSPLRSVCSTQPENFYKLLDVPETFLVDDAILSSRFKSLQRIWHPDKYGRADPAARQNAADMSARLNLAYETLREPARRAQHLLNILAPDHTVPKLNAEFLMWVVEVREKTNHAKGDPSIISQLRAESQRVLAECITALRDAFDAGAWDRAAEETAKLQYIRRIETALLEAQTH